MLKFLFTPVVLLLFCLTTFAQNAELLATISDQPPNSLSGLGATFTGHLMNDGLLYFKGSDNGLNESVWTTDGTVAGTQELTDELTEGNWNGLRFIDAGVLKRDNSSDVWSILKTGTTQFVTLPDFPTESIDFIEKNTAGQYFFTVEREDNQVLYTTDFNQNTTELGVFHPDQTFLALYAGNNAVTMFNTNSFTSDIPVIYDIDLNQIVSLEDYLSEWFTVTSVEYAYAYDKYMIFSINNSQRYIMNMETEVYESYSFIREPLNYYEYGDDIYVVGEDEVTKFNQTTLANSEVFEEASAFGTSILMNDKLYLNGSETPGGTIGVIEIDLSNDAVTYLPGSDIGNFFYGARFAALDNELYFIVQTEYHLLKKYDFANNEAITMDTLASVTGATVNHALENVNGNLVISRRPMPIGHELYVLNTDVSSNIIENNINVTDLKSVPTVSSTTIDLYLDNAKFGYHVPVNLIDMKGNNISNISLNDGSIDIQNLAVGMYIGLVEFEGRFYRFEIVKQ